MQILVDQSGYALLNHGDTAMLQVAVRRLHRLWPEATIRVLCHDPQRLQELCPEARGLRVSGRADWFLAGAQIGPLQRFSPGLERRARAKFGAASHALTAIKRRLTRRDNGDLHAFFRALRGADLVVASGGGYLTDSFPAHAYATLETLDLAMRMGKPVALLGQGIGPLERPSLRGYASRVLPGARGIGLREGLVGPQILREMGVPAERVLVTGDDAIELAFAPDAPLGEAIGINLRLTDYSQVGEQTLETVRAALHQGAQRHGAALAPVPISFYPKSADSQAICELLRGFDDSSDGGATFTTPAHVIEAVARCRIVVTGSYHAAVFALSQGISVVGLAHSAYYVGKFNGLAHQFGPGCQTVLLNQDDAPQRLKSAIDLAWDEAPTHRPSLLSAARRQIEQSQAFYEQLRSLV